MLIICLNASDMICCGGNPLPVRLMLGTLGGGEVCGRYAEACVEENAKGVQTGAWDDQRVCRGVCGGCMNCCAEGFMEGFAEGCMEECHGCMMECSGMHRGCAEGAQRGAWGGGCGGTVALSNHGFRG